MTREEIAEELEAWLYNGGGDTTQLQRDVMDKIDAYAAQLAAKAVTEDRQRVKTLAKNHVTGRKGEYADGWNAALEVMSMWTPRAESQNDKHAPFRAFAGVGNGASDELPTNALAAGAMPTRKAAED